MIEIAICVGPVRLIVVGVVVVIDIGERQDKLLTASTEWTQTIDEKSISRYVYYKSP